MHLVIGTGGAPFSSPNSGPAPAWLQDQYYLWGYGVLSIANSTHLQVDWVNSANRKLFRRVVVTQNELLWNDTMVVNSGSGGDKGAASWVTDVILACVSRL